MKRAARFSIALLLILFACGISQISDGRMEQKAIAGDPQLPNLPPPPPPPQLA